MKLGRYYIDLNIAFGEDFSEYRFDEGGVPMIRVPQEPDWCYNPVTVCQYGLHHFNRFLLGPAEESKQIFLSQAAWLLDHAESGVEDSRVWFYPFDRPFYRLFSPWISGMAQGEAVSVLLRAHQLTGERGFMTTARHAWKIFEVEVRHGGVVSYFPDGGVMIEEYPSSEFFTGVLNGFIFAIFGIYDYALYTGEETAHRFFYSLVESLKNNLHRYDCGYWSKYDLMNPVRLASKSYHRLHIQLLNELYTITRDSSFKIFQDRWQGYLMSSRCRLKWALRKVHQKLFLRL